MVEGVVEAVVVEPDFVCIWEPDAAFECTVWSGGWALDGSHAGIWSDERGEFVGVGDEARLFGGLEG